MVASIIDPDTLQAYRETDYRVLGDTPFVLHIEEHAPALAALHAQLRVDCSAFITACNPLGVRQDAGRNDTLHRALGETLRSRRFAVVEGLGRHPTGAWPGEPSWLIPGLALPAAQALGRQCAQNAIVWAGADAVPRLVLLR